MLLSHTDFRGGANVFIPVAETTTHFVTEVCTLFSLFCMARCHRLVTEFVSLFLFTFYSLRKKNSLPLQRDHNEWTVVNNEVEVRECLLISRMCLFRKSPPNSPVGQNDDEFPCFKEEL